MDIKLRIANLDDLDRLQEISQHTFYETFSAENTEENMRTYLEESFTPQKLATELKDPNTIFYFAMQNEKVVGYLKLNFGLAQTELKEDQGLEIERIYVLKEFQGERIGQALYKKAMEVARQKNASYIWLGVWERNSRAIRFYEKNGFVAFEKHIFKLGDDEQTDIMMKRLLTDGE